MHPPEVEFDAAGIYRHKAGSHQQRPGSAVLNKRQSALSTADAAQVRRNLFAEGKGTGTPLRDVRGPIPEVRHIFGDAHELWLGTFWLLDIM